MIPPKLTKKQVEAIELDLLYGKKHWSEKITHAIGVIKSFYKEIDASNLKWFLEVYVPSEKKRLHQEFINKSATGELHNKYTPTDVANSLGRNFEIVESPITGNKYHLSWAFKAAVFVLKRIEGQYCYLDNPRNPRKELLRAKVTDLRHVNKR